MHIIKEFEFNILSGGHEKFKSKPLFLNYIPGSGEAVGTKIASSPVTSDQ